MIIILEGIDKTGKSTLAKILAERLGYPVEREGPPPRLGDEYWGRGFEYYCMRMDSSPDDAIWDRMFHGELVYGKLWRNLWAYQPWQLPDLEARLMQRPHIVVCCTADHLDIMQRIENDLEADDLDVFVFKNIHAFVEEYNALFETMGCNKIVYNSSEKAPEEFADELIETLGLGNT